MARHHRDAVVGGAFRRAGRGAADHADDLRVEELVERLADGILVADAVELLELAVPPHHFAVAIEDREAVVERLEDVLAELAHALELVGLGMELAIEAAVLER